MNNKKITNRRKNFFANKLHRDIFLLVFLASLTPTILITIALYFLIFGVTADQMVIPESIAYNIIPAAQKVFGILLVVMPVVTVTILFFAYRISHAIVGPFDRIINDLDLIIAGKSSKNIIIRKDDKFWPLISRINKLIEK